MTKMDPSRKTRAKARARGRPKRSERVIGPAELDQIREMWVRGETQTAIGTALDVDRSVVARHLDRNIIPVIRQSQAIDTRKQLARVEYLYRVAWELFAQSQSPEKRISEEELIARATEHGEETAQLAKRITSKMYRVGDSTWLDLVKWCLDFLAKCGGMYTTQYAGDQKDTELRVAGLTPDQLDEMNMARIARRVKERREYQEALKSQGVDSGPGQN